jgi:UDP-glucose 4-epimerase
MNNESGSMINNFQSQKILISGAAGNIGRALTTRLLENGHKVMCLTTNPDNLLDISVTFKDLSLIQLSSWMDFKPFEIEEIDTYVHLAGQTSAYIAREDVVTDIKTNLLSLAQITNCILKNQNQIKKVVLASSMTQYGQVSSLPINETFPISSATFYEMGKNFNEIFVKTLAKDNRILLYNFLRLSNVYGGYNAVQKNRGFLDMSINRALEGDPLYFYGSGDYIRDFIYIEDVVEAFVKSVEENAGDFCGPYNIGSGIGISIKQALVKVSEIVAAHVGIRPQVLSGQFPDNSFDIERRNSVADSSLFSSQTGWKPKTSFDNGIAEIIKRSTY